ncbi:hypothetical protein [Inquilinus sp.]|uniref:hypothetical protein n=1 Tax=Inquilinus sp. TaxID=1932117 RepID=UPI0031CF1652
MTLQTRVLRAVLLAVTLTATPPLIAAPAHAQPSWDEDQPRRWVPREERQRDDDGWRRDDDRYYDRRGDDHRYDRRDDGRYYDRRSERDRRYDDRYRYSRRDRERDRDRDRDSSDPGEILRQLLR